MVSKTPVSSVQLVIAKAGGFVSDLMLEVQQREVRFMSKTPFPTDIGQISTSP
jgi:hypothetical protein